MAVKQETITNDLTVEGVLTAQGISSPEISALQTQVTVNEAQTASAIGIAQGIQTSIADDGIVTPDEKKTIARERGAILAEYPTIIANAEDEGIMADNPIRILFEQAYTAILAFINSLLTNPGENSPVDRTVFTTTVTDYYDSRANILRETGSAYSAGVALAATFLQISSSSFLRNRSGTITPTTLDIYGKKQDGSLYSGRFIISITDGVEPFTDVYTSASDESSYSYAVPSTYTPGGILRYVAGIRIRLYKAGGTTELLSEKNAAVSSDQSVNPIYWGALTADPTGGMAPDDYYWDNRDPASGGGVLRYWTGSVWAQATPVLAWYNTAQAMALNDMMVWAKANGVSSIEAVNAVFQSIAASNAFISSLQAQTLAITGTLRTGPGAETNARVGIQDETGISSKTFSGIGKDDLVVAEDGAEAGTFTVKITKDVNRYPVGSAGPAGGKVFYTDPTDGYVLEAQPADLGSSNTWGATIVTGASGTAVKTGEGNTAEILNDPMFHLVGSGVSISGGIIAALNSTDIAIHDTYFGSIYTYRWNGSTWSQIGTGFTITSAVFTALNSTDIALISADYIRTLRWNGSTWSQIGTGYGLGGATNYNLTALNSTDIAIVENTYKLLRTYRWNGSTWGPIGTGLSMGGNIIINPSLTALNSTDIAYIDNSLILRTYRWNGSTWAQIGAGLTISTVTAPSITKLNSTDIAIAYYCDLSNQNVTLAIYRWNGSTWSQIGTGIIISTATYPHITALNSTDIAYVDNNNKSLRTYTISSAAKDAVNATYGGYSDWFLPSRDELALMYANRAAIGGFVAAKYWSSSETGAGNAWAQDFTDGTQSNPVKLDANLIRPIRKFYIKDFFAWAKDGGAYSADQEISNYSVYPLGATSGIKVFFPTNIGHITNDVWTLIQGSMYGLSIEDASGVEYVRASSGDFLIKSLKCIDTNQPFSTAPPIGYVYWQLPGKSDPATLYPGTTWSNVSSSFAGDFFRAEGGNALAFEGGEQGDTLQGHWHAPYANASANTNSPYNTPTVGSYSGGTGVPYYATDPIADNHGNGTPRTGNETRPKNRTIRLWERTA